ncbi:MAG: OmpH family outer membrane protein [Acidobacteriota bacterium]|nr:OmpH family outer membrane protein [Acidobacteriota bacterium]
MKIRLIAAFAFVLAVAVSPVLAQTRPGAPAATPPQSSTSGVPEGRIALIYSQAFSNEKTGIARFTALFNTLNREFLPRQTELQGIQKRIETLTNEVNQAQAAASVVDPKSIQLKIDQLETLKTELKRKGEDAQAAYNRRKEELFSPLQEEIGRALEAYAKARNINVIIDGSTIPLVYAADTLDITRAFINEFNSKNPATAAVAPVK